MDLNVIPTVGPDLAQRVGLPAALVPGWHAYVSN
jgi:hypothetical protein